MNVILKKVDMFGLQFNFRTFGSSHFKTTLGGFLTLFLYIMAVYFTYFFGQDLFYKKNPNVTVNDLVHLETKKVEISNDKFSMMFRLDNLVGQPYDLNGFPFQFLVTYYHYKYDKNRNLNRYCNPGGYDFASKCSTTKAKFIPALEKENLDLWMCFDMEKIKVACREEIGNKEPNYEPIFGGSQDEEEFAGLRLDIVNYIWDSKTKEYTYFATQEEIDKVESIKLHLRYPNVSYNSKQSGNPLQVYYESQNIRLDKNAFRDENRFMKIVTANDDFGWLYANVTSQSVMAPNYVDLQNLPLLQGRIGNQIWKVFFRSLIWNNKHEKEYNRNFMKIQNLVAIVSGMLKSFLVIFSLSALYKANKDRSIELVRRFYKVKIAKSDVSVHPLVKETTEMKTIEKPSKEKEMNLSFFAYFLRCYVTSEDLKNRLKIYEKMQGYLEEKFDLEHFLKVSEQFEKMKDLVLSEEQKELIENNLTEVELEI